MKHLKSLLLVLLLAATVRAESKWQLVDEAAYIVEMAGGRAGEMTTRVETDGERFRSGFTMDLRIRRGRTEIAIGMSSLFIETLDGAPVELHTTQDLGVQVMETRYTFQEDGVVVTSRQGARETTQLKLLPRFKWLTPMAVSRYIEQQLADGAEEIRYMMIDGQLGLDPIGMAHRRTGNEIYELDDRKITVTVFETTTTVMPRAKGIEKYDAEGRLVYQETDMGGLGKMIVRLATPAQLAADPGAAPEILVQTFVEPNGRMPGVQGATSATLKLRAKDGEMPELPSAGAQRITLDGEGAATLTIDIADNLAAPADEINDAVFTGSSGMIDARDPLVAKLAKRAVRTSGDAPQDRAEALRRSVFQLVDDKGLDTAFASASEVARMRRGDCSEHAVLLCAMLRADGIPARVAVGLIYAEGFLGHRDIFGWHMWTQAMIDGKWVDFDATLPSRYHAGHILTATSPLADSAIDVQLAASVMLMGNLEIDVVDVGYE